METAQSTTKSVMVGYGPFSYISNEQNENLKRIFGRRFNESHLRLWNPQTWGTVV